MHCLAWPFGRDARYRRLRRRALAEAQARFARSRGTLEAARRDYGEAVSAGDAEATRFQQAVLDEALRRYAAARLALQDFAESPQDAAAASEAAIPLGVRPVVD